MLNNHIDYLAEQTSNWGGLGAGDMPHLITDNKNPGEEPFFSVRGRVLGCRSDAADNNEGRKCVLCVLWSLPGAPVSPKPGNETFQVQNEPCQPAC